MANRTTLSQLAARTQDLLRTTDKSAEAMTWVNTALSEICTRTSGLMTRRAVHFSIAAGVSEAGKAYFEISAICPNFVSPISLFIVIQGAGSLIYTPRYLPPPEFFRTASWKTAASQGAQIEWYTIARVGSNTPSSTLADLKTLGLYIDPGLVASTTRWCYLTYMATPIWQSSSGNYIECFPHWEHVVIWKAAAIGARAIKHRLHDIFELEANHALQTMYTVEKYQPDTVPMSLGTDRVLTGTRRFQYALPQEIG